MFVVFDNFDGIAIACMRNRVDAEAIVKANPSIDCRISFYPNLVDDEWLGWDIENPFM
jgi:hypothetical protein